VDCCSLGLARQSKERTLWAIRLLSPVQNKMVWKV
jgi:hypothetical protein